MGIKEIIGSKRKQVLEVARKHGVGSVRVFGSVARGEASTTSDVDLLIEVNGPTPPWFPGGLVADLEDLLDRDVDVIEPESLREEFRQRVLNEAIAL